MRTACENSNEVFPSYICQKKNPSVNVHTNTNHTAVYIFKIYGSGITSTEIADGSSLKSREYLNLLRETSKTKQLAVTSP